MSQLHTIQVFFLRDPASNRSGSHASHEGLAAPHEAQSDALALDEMGCKLHDNCDDCNYDAHAHSHGDHFSWLLDTQALGPKAIVPLLLAIVLSVHSFIAGMALGVQESSAAAVPTLIAIVAHKWVEAISLGVSVVRVTPDRRALLRCAAAVKLAVVAIGGFQIQL
jgi:zinc transporter ZupT